MTHPRSQTLVFENGKGALYNPISCSKIIVTSALHTPDSHSELLGCAEGFDIFDADLLVR